MLSFFKKKKILPILIFFHNFDLRLCIFHIADVVRSEGEWRKRLFIFEIRYSKSHNLFQRILIFSEYQLVFKHKLSQEQKSNTIIPSLNLQFSDYFLEHATLRWNQRYDYLINSRLNSKNNSRDLYMFSDLNTFGSKV